MGSGKGKNRAGKHLRKGILSLTARRSRGESDGQRINGGKLRREGSVHVFRANTYS